MLGTFILGLAAGWGAPHAEPKIRSALEGLLPDGITLAVRDWSLLALGLCLLGAAILAAILTTAYAVPLALGAVVGVFVPKLVEKWRAARTPDYDS
ncbi:MAG: hypothetical protein HKN98_09045 [Silicimonas sp.]|nr:hypothetical protein [Silicimonas sp.]NND18712.1 hypothetical protein [Silicimonas sp.]NND22825.1 hypothetical protein [Silicimonas sp.]NND42256.1 hypothetical protein [Silicimonas sp.]NNF92099.1 hypothetical protein [Boseongicola sp.]